MQVTETVMGQPFKLILVSEVLPLFPLHPKPGCMFLSSYLSPKSCSSHTACRHIRELRSVENERYNTEAQIHGCKPIHPSYTP